MLKTASLMIGGILGSFLAYEAQAFPVAPASVRVTAPEVLQVRDFCGLGFHRDIYGYCVRNGVPYGYVAPGAVVVAPPLAVAPPVVVAPPVMVAPRVCPYGYAWAPAYGRCVPI
jgi:hypothetical protein